MRKISSVFTTLLFFIHFNAFAQTSQPTSQESQPVKPRVGNINPADKDKYRTRYEAKDNRFFAFGAARGIHLNNENVLYAINAGYSWEVGANGALPGEVFAVFGSKTLYADAGIGYKHFFSDEDFSFFLKGTVGMGAANFQSSATVANPLTNSESVNGFAMRASAGATFFRTSTKSLELSVSYGVIMSDSSLGYPHILAATIGFLY